MLLKSWLVARSRGTQQALLCALLLVAALITGACTVSPANDTTTTGTGSLVVNWTLASSNAPTACTTYGAQTVSVQVFNSSNLQVNSANVACTAFSTTFTALAVGSYSVKAQVLDVSGTVLANLPAAVVVNIQDTLISSQALDFPATAFTPVTVSTGSLIVDWTVAMASNASECAAHAAASIAIQLFDSSNVQYGTTSNVACSALSTTITTVPAGTYILKAQLLDANNTAITTVVGPVPVVIASGSATTQTVDFSDASFTTTTPVTSTLGELTVTWTIASVADASQCTANGASSMVLQLMDSTNAPVGTPQTLACSAFTATLPSLTPGTYTLTAKLVNASNTDVTTTATVPGIAVAAGVTTTQAIDFPNTSFLMPATGTGSIGVTWSINSGADASNCTAHNAAYISLQLYRSDATTLIGSAILDACSAFSTTIANVQPGSYALSAQLVDATAAAVTTKVPPQAITVAANATATQAFDFPTSSFMQ